MLKIRARRSDLAWSTHRRVASKLMIDLPRLRVVLPDGRLFEWLCKANSFATIGEVSEHWRSE